MASLIWGGAKLFKSLTRSKIPSVKSWMSSKKRVVSLMGLCHSLRRFVCALLAALSGCFLVSGGSVSLSDLVLRG